ncbi:unnamed protein product, partial [Coregonus sp. 'balchen']
MEPTLQLLGVSFDLSMAQAVMREQHGAATRLLYQLFILLQKKKKAGLTGTAMEAMQPAATACLHRVENDIYSERLRTVVKREADLKLQKIALKYEIKGREIYDKSVMAHSVKEQKQQKVQEVMRLQDIEKHRHARRKQHEIMTRIQTAIIQIPKPPPNQTLKALEKQQQNRKIQEAQKVHMEIAQFEKNRKKLSPAGGFGTSSLRSHGSQLQRPEELARVNSEYIQKIRQRLEEDAAARQQREKRRRRVLVEQLKAHEAQELERRLAVQLMQLRQQKDVLRQNRALARQASLDHAEETRKEMEVHNRIAAERAQARYRKHFDSCREMLEQIVDLATKAGEYRLLTGNLIPGKLMREWKELLFCGKPLYDSGSLEELPADPTPEQFIEVEKQEILNNQDYDEYMSMTGEWTWPEEGEAKPPPSNNNILGHVVLRLQTIVNPPKPDTLPPFFPRFTLKACVLGKLFSGKSTCLTRIAQANVLIQEALAAHQLGELGCEHGAGVENFLRKGRSVPDELLVDIVVEAIRAIPADSGWILDGFPVDLTQAKLLEKALGGSDPGKERKRRNKRSILSVDSNAPKDPPPPSPVLDLALLLDSILVRLIAEMSEDMLFRKVESILYQAMMQSEKGEEVVLDSGKAPAVSPPLVQVAPVAAPAPTESTSTLTQEGLTPAAVMQNLRTERILIIHHLFNIREEFKQYLRRPDLKQEFVSQWQQDYNSIPKDMRDDEDTKAELHQRLDDLRERLWDICDKRKEEAGQERAAVMCDGWLEDHTAVLINHFSTLMQVEVDRFQDSLRLLRDYYTGMYRQVLPEAGPEFTCIPLLDIKGFQDPDEKLLHDIYQTALTAINNMVSAEAAQREAEESEEAQQQMDRERLQRMSQASAAAANSGKDKKKAGTRKKGPPSPAQEPSPPPPPEEDSEECELMLVCTDFFLNGDIRVVVSPPPPPRPAPLELPIDSTLTILQLEAFYHQLRKFFFLLFADPDCSPARVDYVTMLLYFAAHPDPVQGFVRALSDFVKVYRELGYKVEDKIPFSILSQHPVIQDLIEGSAQYQLIDIHQALQVQQSEGEPLSLAVS